MYNLDGETKVAHVLRKRTIELMPEFNPKWRDLNADWFGATLALRIVHAAERHHER